MSSSLSAKPRLISSALPFSFCVFVSPVYFAFSRLRNNNTSSYFLTNQPEDHLFYMHHLYNNPSNVACAQVWKALLLFMVVCATCSSSPQKRIVGGVNAQVNKVRLMCWRLLSLRLLSPLRLVSFLGLPILRTPLATTMLGFVEEV